MQKKCQCPTRANHHFYERGKEWLNIIFMVSMPYTGEPPFLHANKYGCVFEADIVSMPYTGEPPFLLTRATGWSKEEKRCVNALYGRTTISTERRCLFHIGEDKLCQCPIRANHHFYGRGLKKDIVMETCVNALYGRTTISTVPL